MKISIIDHAYNRVIIAQVPTYLTDATDDTELIADAIFDALGITHTSSEYIIGDFKAQVDIDTWNENGTGMHKLEELTQDFEQDALTALKESQA